jgi:hypothetical protein
LVLLLLLLLLSHIEQHVRKSRIVGEKLRVDKDILRLAIGRSLVDGGEWNILSLVLLIDRGVVVDAILDVENIAISCQVEDREKDGCANASHDTAGYVTKPLVGVWTGYGVAEGGQFHLCS